MLHTLIDQARQGGAELEIHRVRKRAKVRRADTLPASCRPATARPHGQPTTAPLPSAGNMTEIKVGDDSYRTIAKSGACFSFLVLPRQHARGLRPANQGVRP